MVSSSTQRISQGFACSSLPGPVVLSHKVWTFGGDQPITASDECSRPKSQRNPAIDGRYVGRYQSPNLVYLGESSNEELPARCRFPPCIMPPVQSLPVQVEKKPFIPNHQIRICKNDSASIDWSLASSSWSRSREIEDPSGQHSTDPCALTRFQLLDDARRWICFCSPIGYGNKILWEQAAYIRRCRGDLVVNLTATELPSNWKGYRAFVRGEIQRMPASEQAIDELLDAAFSRKELSLFINEVEAAIRRDVRDVEQQLDSLKRFLNEHNGVGCYIDCSPYAADSLRDGLFSKSQNWTFVQCLEFGETQYVKFSEHLSKRNVRLPAYESLPGDFRIPAYLSTLVSTDLSTWSDRYRKATARVFEFAGKLAMDINATDIRQFLEALAYETLFWFEDPDLDKLEYPFSPTDLRKLVENNCDFVKLIRIANSTSIVTVFDENCESRIVVRWRTEEIRNFLAAMFVARNPEYLSGKLRNGQLRIKDPRFEQVATFVQQAADSSSKQNLNGNRKPTIPKPWKDHPERLPHALHSLQRFKILRPTEDGLIVRYFDRKILLVCSAHKVRDQDLCVSFGTTPVSSAKRFIEIDGVTPNNSQPLFNVCWSTEANQWTLVVCKPSDRNKNATSSITNEKTGKTVEFDFPMILQEGDAFINTNWEGSKIIRVTKSNADLIFLRCKNHVDLVLIRPEVSISEELIVPIDNANTKVRLSKEPGMPFQVVGECGLQLSVDHDVPRRWAPIVRC